MSQSRSTPVSNTPPFESFTAPNLCAIFEVGPKRVTSETTSGEQVQELRDARASFKGFWPA
jgi:hypothetical protein